MIDLFAICWRMNSWRDSGRGDRAARIATGLFMLLFGIALAALGLAAGDSAWREYRSGFFVSTNGIVTHQWIGPVNARGRKEAVYIGYTYTVAGKSHRGEQASKEEVPCDPLSRPEVLRFGIGRSILVHFDPADPDRSQLTKGLTAGGLVKYLAILPFCAFGLYMILEAMRLIDGRGNSAATGAKRSSRGWIIPMANQQTLLSRISRYCLFLLGTCWPALALMGLALYAVDATDSKPAWLSLFSAYSVSGAVFVWKSKTNQLEIDQHGSKVRFHCWMPGLSPRSLKINRLLQWKIEEYQTQHFTGFQLKVVWAGEGDGHREFELCKEMDLDTIKELRRLIVEKCELTSSRPRPMESDYRITLR